MSSELTAPLTASIADGSGDQLTVAVVVPEVTFVVTLAGVLMIGGSLSELNEETKDGLSHLG